MTKIFIPNGDGSVSHARSRKVLYTLVAASAVSPLGINMYLPSMPLMARSLGVDYTSIQLTLSLYLAAMAGGQFIIGALSDRYGRRPILLGGLAVFLIGSVLCATAQSIEVLLVGRVIQAIGGCSGVTLGRAIVRDLYRGNEVASMIGYVTMGMAIAPMIAPTIGGLLETYYGWRGSFVFLAVFGGLALVVVFFIVPETNHARFDGGHLSRLMRDYVGLAKSRLFWGYTLTTAFISGVFFSFLAGAPYVTIELMGRSAAEYGFYFSLVPGGYILGNFLSGRYSTVVGAHQLIIRGITSVIVGVTIGAILLAVGIAHPLGLFVPMLLVGLGNGLVLPTGIAGAVNLRPEVAGAAAGLSGSVQIGMGAIVAPIVGATLTSTAWPLLAMMASCVLLATITFAFLQKWSKHGPVA